MIALTKGFTGCRFVLQASFQQEEGCSACQKNGRARFGDLGSDCAAGASSALRPKTTSPFPTVTKGQPYL